MTALLPALVGAAAAAGLIMVVAAFRPRPARPDGPPRNAAWWTRLAGYYSGPKGWRRRILTAGGVSAGIGIWLATGWLAACLLAPAAAVGLPHLLRPAEAKTTIARLAALEEWTRSLAGVLDVGLGLEHALITSARTAPEPIAGQVGNLAHRLRSGVRLPDALWAFADELSDATGDYIVAALQLAARRRGGGVVNVLEGLAATVAAQVGNRQDIEAELERSRTSARWVTIIAIVALGLLSFISDFLQPYTTPSGQAVFVVLLAAYVGCLLWMRKAANSPPMPRILAGRRRQGETAANSDTELLAEVVG